MKRYLRLLSCAIILVSLSGCWSSREPKQLAYVDSSVILKDADGGYTIVVAIMNPLGLGGAGVSGTGSGDKSPYVTFTGTGPSIREAITDQSASREKGDFGAHQKAIFLSESFAEEQGNMTSLLDFIARERLTDEKPLLVVVKGEHPERIYDSMIGISSLVGEYVRDMSKSQTSEMAKGVFETVLDFIRDYYTYGKEPVTGLITIVESKDKASDNTKIGAGNVSDADGQQSSYVNYKLKYQGLAAFRGGELVGFLDGDETQAYNFLENKIKSAVITVPVGETGSTVLNVVGSRAAIKVNASGGKAVIDVKIKAAAVVSMDGGKIDVTTPEGLKEIEESFNREMETQILEVIKKAQAEFKSDIFGFGQSLHIQHPDIWGDFKDSWNDDSFPSAAVSVSVETEIVRTGKAEKPIAIGGAHA